MSSLRPLEVPHVIRGQVDTNYVHEYRNRVGEMFTTPQLDIDDLVVPRSIPGPAFDLPIAEVLDFLAEVGNELRLESNQFLAEALELMTLVSPHSRRLIENSYRSLGQMFDAEALGFQIERELGVGALDAWIPVYRPGVPRSCVRAFPPRLIHIMAGNGPAAAAISIIRGALTKGVNLLKMPSNDLFTATAILRTMAEIDAKHPVVESFSAVYWRGGDSSIEDVLYRPQYFDKLVAWGGAETIRHAVRYIGPGFELVAYDPKISISLIGREHPRAPGARSWWERRCFAVRVALAGRLGRADACGRDSGRGATAVIALEPKSPNVSLVGRTVVGICGMLP